MTSTEFSGSTPQITPVTILSGFLSADKTTLLNNPLTNSQGRKIAVIVNDFSEVNVDTTLIKQGMHPERGEDRLIEMSNDCICCTLRDNLTENVGKLVRSGKFEYIITGSTGISESMPVVTTFEWEFDGGRRLADIVPIGTMIMLIGASTLLDSLRQGRALSDDEHTAADLLVDQVESVDLILITKSDLVDDKLTGSIEEIIHVMNPRVRIVHVTNGEAVISAILSASFYDEGTTAISHGYAEESANPHTSEAEEYGISSAVFRGNHPFSRGRLIKALRGTKGLVRPKGHYWISGRLEVAHVWSQAGPNLKITSVVMWVQTDIPPSNGVVLIGVKFNPETILQAFEDAMLTDEEVRGLL